MLLLPMKNDQGEISRILGCLVANGAPTNPPHRFAIASRKITRIVASDFQPARKQSAGFAETPQGFTPAPTHAKAPSHLTLVVNDETD